MTRLLDRLDEPLQPCLQHRQPPRIARRGEQGLNRQGGFFDARRAAGLALAAAAPAAAGIDRRCQPRQAALGRPGFRFDRDRDTPRAPGPYRRSGSPRRENSGCRIAAVASFRPTAAGRQGIACRSEWPRRSNGPQSNIARPARPARHARSDRRRCRRAIHRANRGGRWANRRRRSARPGASGCPRWQRFDPRPVGPRPGLQEHR